LSIYHVKELLRQATCYLNFRRHPDEDRAQPCPALFAYNKQASYI